MAMCSAATGVAHRGLIGTVPRARRQVVRHAEGEFEFRHAHPARRQAAVPFRRRAPSPPAAARPMVRRRRYGAGPPYWLAAIFQPHSWKSAERLQPRLDRIAVGPRDRGATLRAMPAGPSRLPMLDQQGGGRPAPVRRRSCCKTFQDDLARHRAAPGRRSARCTPAAPPKRGLTASRAAAGAG